MTVQSSSIGLKTCWALRSRELRQFGQCVTGALGRSPFFSKIAIATPGVCERLFDPHLRDYILGGDDRPASQEKRGVMFIPFVSKRQTTFAVSLGDREDRDLMLRHLALLDKCYVLSGSLAKSREIFFAMMGVRVNPGIVAFSESHYRLSVGSGLIPLLESSDPADQAVDTITIRDDSRNQNGAIRRVVMSNSNERFFLISELQRIGQYARPTLVGL